MPFTYPHYGNIITMESAGTVNPGHIKILGGGQWDFDTQVRIDMSWIPADKEFDYTTLTNKKVLYVNSYKLVINIVIPYATRQWKAMHTYLLDYFNKTIYNFNSNGLVEDRSVILQLMGNEDTAPKIRVKLREYEEDEFELLAEKYIGYSNLIIPLISLETFDRPSLPLRVAIPDIPTATIVTEHGVLDSAIAMPELEIFD